MYQELKDSDSYGSNPPTHLDFQEDPAPNPMRVEILHSVTADDSLFGLALKYDQRLAPFSLPI